LSILSEGFRVASQSIQNSFLVVFILRHVSAINTVAILTAEDLKVETLAVHLQTFCLLAVAASLLYLLDFILPLSTFCAAADFSSWFCSPLLGSFESTGFDK